MTVAELIDQAVTHQDGEAACRVAEHLRLRRGYTYRRILELVQKRHPETTMAEWDALLREGE